MAKAQQRVVIVTGAGQGIGRAYAHGFAKQGDIVVVAELNSEKASAVATEIEVSGGQAFAATTDVSNPASCSVLVDAVLARYERIDVLVNNAAVFATIKMKPFDEITIDEWNQVLGVNITGVWLMTKAVLPAMKNARWGRVINVGSAAVTMGRPNYLHYIASKGAVAAMTRSMAREVGSFGITVNAVLPGAVETEIPRQTVTPEQLKMFYAMRCINRAETPEDMVGAVLFFASDAAGFVSGQALTVDGGHTHT